MLTAIYLMSYIHHFNGVKSKSQRYSQPDLDLNNYYVVNSNCDSEQYTEAVELGEHGHGMIPPILEFLHVCNLFDGVNKMNYVFR
jgi:hypothetical protein